MIICRKDVSAVQSVTLSPFQFQRLRWIAEVRFLSVSPSTVRRLSNSSSSHPSHLSSRSQVGVSLYSIPYPHTLGCFLRPLFNQGRRCPRRLCCIVVVVVEGVGGVEAVLGTPLVVVVRKGRRCRAWRRTGRCRGRIFRRWRRREIVVVIWRTNQGGPRVLSQSYQWYCIDPLFRGGLWSIREERGWIPA
jgi:hypothetical protein